MAISWRAVGLFGSGFATSCLEVVLLGVGSTERLGGLYWGRVSEEALL